MQNNKFFTEKPKVNEENFEELDDLTIEALRAEADDDEFDYETYKEEGYY